MIVLACASKNRYFLARGVSWIHIWRFWSKQARIIVSARAPGAGRRDRLHSRAGGQSISFRINAMDRVGFPYSRV
jgi:hypothetical protein